jgi:hypothetical protein
MKEQKEIQFELEIDDTESVIDDGDATNSLIEKLKSTSTIFSVFEDKSSTIILVSANLTALSKFIGILSTWIGRKNTRKITIKTADKEVVVRSFQAEELTQILAKIGLAGDETTDAPPPEDD